MCGIVGYMGNKKASPILINGLLRLEYRGYDSAGISTIEKDYISNLKTKGRVNNLYKLDNINSLEGTCGIAHTRWATHGKPSKENSHPHLDNSNSFAVVHNGIIENYTELREFLSNNGYKFLSETDTEVIPNLIHYFYNKETKDSNLRFLKSVKLACDELKGSYAIEVISKLYPDVIIVVRNDSPLVIGMGNEEVFISSDIPAILSYTRNFYFLENNDFAQIHKNEIKFYDKNLNNIMKNIKNIDWETSSTEKEGFEDFMLKEIYEQTRSVRETISSKIQLNKKTEIEDFEFSNEYLNSLNKIYIVACGTAMHAGLACKAIFENLCNISVEVDIASEFRYRNPIITDKTLTIFISQSGETADTIAALKLARSKGAKTLAISNVIGSSITREADYCIYTHAGPEIAVASTKAYTSQITLLSILAVYISERLENKSEAIINEFKKQILELPEKINLFLKNEKEILKIKEICKKLYNEKNMFFLGRGTDYAVALEGSLKMKEISYIHSEAYPAGELKHGPIALIENGIVVVSIITDENLVEKCISNIQEVKTRGARTIVITNQELKNKDFDYVIDIPSVDKFISPIISVIPLQLFSYFTSKEKGLDVDKPRNLAKSVTVE